jgi:hypothetical protein
MERSAALSPGSEFLEPGDNCWKMARADRLACIVNGADYFRFITSAKRLLFIENRFPSSSAIADAL